MAAPEGPRIARQVLDEANVSASDREMFIDSLKSFLTTDSPELDLETADQLAAWGESHRGIVTRAGSVLTDFLRSDLPSMLFFPILRGFML
jgi:hypothetical protein